MSKTKLPPVTRRTSTALLQRARCLVVHSERRAAWTPKKQSAARAHATQEKFSLAPRSLTWKQSNVCYSLNCSRFGAVFISLHFKAEVYLLVVLLHNSFHIREPVASNNFFQVLENVRCRATSATPLSLNLLKRLLNPFTSSYLMESAECCADIKHNIDVMRCVKQRVFLFSWARPESCAGKMFRRSPCSRVLVYLICFEIWAVFLENIYQLYCLTSQLCFRSACSRTGLISTVENASITVYTKIDRLINAFYV